jgi:hypothetical protein
MGQANRARMTREAAAAEAAYWDLDDDPMMSDAFRQERKAQVASIKADGETRARSMDERARETEGDRPLLLWRQDVEALDWSLTNNPEVQQLRLDAMRADLWTPHVTRATEA